MGLGYIRLMLKGWGIKDKTKLFYKKNNQSPENLILEIKQSIFNDNIVMKGVIPSNRP